MMSSGDAHGVIFNVDSVLRMGSLRRLLGRLRSLRTTSLRDRRSMLAMPRLVRALSADLDNAPVFYVTAFPIVLARPITNMLILDGYPSGTLLTTGGASRCDGGRGSRSRKLAGIEHLADRMPNVRWVLIGDDGAYDPQVFVDFAHRRRDRVAVIALRQVIDVDSPRINLPHGARDTVGAALVGAPNGEELLPLVRAAIGIGQPREGSVADWFLSEFERGNEVTDLRPWTEGNAVRPLVHGRVYFTALAQALPRRRRRFGPVRGVAGDADQLLADSGPTVVEALTGRQSWSAGAWAAVARTRGQGGLAGRPEPDARRHGQQGRRRGAADQRVLPLVATTRNGRRPPCWRPSTCAFVGGIDLDHGSRDDVDHRGDRKAGSRSRLRTQPRLPRPTAAAAGPGGAGGRGDLPRAVAEPGAGDAPALARDP